VVTYLTLPLVFMVIHLNASAELDYRLTHGPGFLRDFYVSVTGILISLAGLNTYQAVASKREEGPKTKS